MKNINLLFSDVKNFMANEVNRVFVLFMVITLSIGLFLHWEIQNLKKFIISGDTKLEEEITKTRKRIDYRYFNTTRTLEDLHNVRIDTKNGDLK